ARRPRRRHTGPRRRRRHTQPPFRLPHRQADADADRLHAVAARPAPGGQPAPPDDHLHPRRPRSAAPRLRRPGPVRLPRGHHAYVKAGPLAGGDGQPWVSFAVAFEAYDLPWKAEESKLPVEKSGGLLSAKRQPYPAFEVWRAVREGKGP